jgi:peptide/nickel transport system substrate-binding protein
VATSLPEQQQLAAEIQRQAFVDVPYIPPGQMLAAIACSRDLTSVLAGFALFWNVRRTA